MGTTTRENSESWSFDGFIPSILRNEIRRRPDADRGNFTTTFQAVILFADAEGFSRLCARLVAENTRAPDAIGAIVNNHVGKLNEIVTRHGGSIATFSGDAICAIWPVEGDTLEATLCAATSAGLEIVAEEVTPGIDKVLRFRCAVDCGNCSVWHFENDDRKSAILCGPLLEGLADLSQSGVASKVTLSDAAHGVIGPQCRGRRANGTFVVDRLLEKSNSATRLNPSHVPNPIDGGAAYMSPALRRILGGASGQWIDEICMATIVFVRLPILLGDTQGGFDAVRRLSGAASRVTEDFGGLPLQTMVDDKGLVFLAAWGLAASRSETDARRAVTAARAMLDAARADGVRAGIGVSSSSVFAGAVGDAGFLTYSVLGAAANRAAWLMQQADDNILVDRATRDAAGRFFAFDPAGELQFKGESTTETCFTPGTLRDMLPEPSGRMIGREQDLVAFDRAFSTERLPVVWISGEAGIGKSHFTREARLRLVARELSVMNGAGDNLNRNRPFGAWRRVVLDILQIEPTENGLRTLVQRLDTLPHGAGMLPLIAPILGFAFDSAPHTPPLDPGHWGTRTQQLLLEIIESGIGARRSVIFFEDAHWLDTASWRLIGLVRARLPSTGIVLVNRPLDLWALPEEARALHSEATSMRIPLGRLPIEQTRALVGDVIGADLIPQELARRIHDRADGHPYYTKELAAAMLRRGTIRVENHHCFISTQAENLQSSAFPKNIETAIASRFSELDPAAQLTLKVASAEGRSFAPDAIAPVHPDSPPQGTIARHLDLARELDLVEPAPGVSGQMRFHHALTRDAIYGLMTEKQRRQLHTAIANRLEELNAAADSDMHAVLAHHWESAAETARAISYYDSAAVRAAEAHSHYEETELLRRALNLDATLPVSAGPLVRGGWENRIARAFFQLGNAGASIKHGERAISALIAPMPGKATIVARILVELWRIKTNCPGPRPATAEDGAKLLDAARTCIELSFHTYEVGDLPKSIFNTFLAVNLARRVGIPSIPLAIGNASLAISSLSIPLLFDGMRLHRAAIEVAEQLGDPVASYWVGINCSTYAFATGQLERAVELAEMAIQVGRSQLEARDFEAAASHKANFMRAKGHFHDGFDLDSMTLVSGRDRGVIQGRIWGLNGCCRSLYPMGEIEALRTHTAEIEALLTDPNNSSNLSVNNHLCLMNSKGNLALADRDAKAAVDHFSAAARTLSGVSGPQYYLEEVPGNIGDGLLRSWQLDPSLDVARAALINLKNAKMIAKMYPVGRYRLPLARGDLALYRGHMDRAQKEWRAARDLAKTQGLKLAQAHAWTRLAQPGIGTPDEARTAAGKVAALFDEIGAPQPFHWRQIMDGPA